MRTLGKYSYGLYVYHGILQYQFFEMRLEERLTAALGHHGAAMVAKAALGFGISFAISVASYAVIEKRFLALKRYFEAAPAPAAPTAAVTASTGVAPASSGRGGA